MKPDAAHVAAEAIQEKIQRQNHGESPSCFFIFFHGEITFIQAKLEPLPVALSPRAQSWLLC